MCRFIQKRDWILRIGILDDNGEVIETRILHSRKSEFLFCFIQLTLYGCYALFYVIISVMF